MLDRVFAIVSILGVILFMWIVAVGVMEPDLWIVTLVVLGIAIYDFWKTFRERKQSHMETEKPSETGSVQSNRDRL